SADLDAPGAQSVQVRFGNTGGKPYLRAEMHLVYKPEGKDGTNVTFAWNDGAGPHRDAHVFRAGANPPWPITTGKNVKTQRVEFDPIRRLWIHHAGHDGVPQGFHVFTCDLDNGIWQQRFPNTSPPGACCVDGAHVFDIAHERYVRFPGASLGHGYQWSRGVK